MEFPVLNSLPAGDMPDLSISEKLVVLNKSIGMSKNVILGRDKEKGLLTDWLILLGKVVEKSTPNFRNANIWLDVNKPKVIFIAGRRGTGKSYDLGVIAEGLISTKSKIAVKDSKISGIFFDIQNIFWSMMFEPSESDSDEKKQLEELEKWGLDRSSFDIKVFAPRGSRDNLPNFREFSIKPSDLNDDDWCQLFGYEKYSQPSGQLIASAYRKVTQEGYSEVPSKEDYSIDDIINCIEGDPDINSETRGFNLNVRRAVSQKFSEANGWCIFSDHGTELTELYAPDTFSVILLKDLDISTQVLVIGLITKKVYEARSRANTIEKQYRKLNNSKDPKYKEILKGLDAKRKQLNFPPCWLFLDEAHVICPSDHPTTAKEHLIQYVKLGRDKGLSLVFATQQPSAVDSRLISQRDIIIAHTLGISQDIVTAENQMGCDIPSEINIDNTNFSSYILQRLIRSLKRGEAVFADDEVNRIFIGKIRPRISSHGGADETMEKYLSND